MLIGIQDEIMRLSQLGLLEPLLRDQTTGRNILWATDAYTELGRAYAKTAEITPDLIIGEHSGVIRNRARKDLELQSDRTKSHAEVFTPIWVCNRMIDSALAESDQSPRKKRKDDFIQTRWLEITCGEAPFLVQRYDVLTGEIIPIEQRKGILDRKLQWIRSKVSHAGGDLEGAMWLKQAIRAFQSVYGYELQGDNLLIARLNLYMTFEEYLEYIYHRKPTRKESLKIVDIITWNLWQMDGLTHMTPCSEDPASPQRSLFDFMGISDKPKETPKPCQIRFHINARKILSFTLTQLAEQGDQAMKFDYIIGNPPYQEETVEETSSMNGQASVKNVFHLFQMEVDKISNCSTVLIYPSKRWLHRSGKGMNEFGFSQINSSTLSKIINYPNAKEVFKDSSINDGVGIVIKNQKKTKKEFTYEYHKNGVITSIQLSPPGDELLVLDPKDYNICNKISKIINTLKIKYLNNRILPRSLFGIESSFVQQNPTLVELYSINSKIDYSKKIKLLTNDKAGSAGRTRCYITNRDTIKCNQKYIDEWQVIAISANAGGQRRDNQLEIVDNHTAFGRSKVALGSFSSQEEAHNFYSYLKTYLIRFMFLMTDENLTSLGKKVPDILDYTSSNKFIDFSRDLNEQLFNLFELSDDEIKYIKSTIDEIKKKRGEADETHVKAMT